MRKKIVAGNWKMNKTLQEGIELAKDLNEKLTADKPNCGVVICTPFIHLASVAGMIDESIMSLGAENCADKEKVHIQAKCLQKWLNQQVLNTLFLVTAKDVRTMEKQQRF